MGLANTPLIVIRYVHRVKTRKYDGAVFGNNANLARENKQYCSKKTNDKPDLVQEVQEHFCLSEEYVAIFVVTYSYLLPDFPFFFAERCQHFFVRGVRCYYPYFVWSVVIAHQNTILICHHVQILKCSLFAIVSGQHC